MMTDQKVDALTPRNMRRFALMQRCFDLGSDDTVCTMTWRTGPRDREGLWVSGGLNSLIGWVDGYRFRPGRIAELRDSGQFTDDFLERLRSARATVDIAGIEEGDIIQSGSMILELQGSNLNCLLVSTMVENTVGMGTEIATRAVALRRAHPNARLVYHPSHLDQQLLAETAIQIARWDASSDPDVACKVNLPTEAHREATGPSVQYADPRDTVAAAGFLTWHWEWSALCSEFASWEQDLKLVGGGTSKRLYRILDAQGEWVEDVEEPTGTPVGENMRKVVQRYADRGHPCRPLPGPLRSAALHQRAAAEFAHKR